MNKLPKDLTGERADRAASQAWADAVARHHSNGEPVYAMRDGVLVAVAADGTTVRVDEEEMAKARAECSDEPAADKDRQHAGPMPDTTSTLSDRRRRAS